MRAPYGLHSVRNLDFATSLIFVCGLDEVCGPALTITLEWSESLNDLDLAVTEPDGTLVRFSNLVGVSKSSNGARLKHIHILQGSPRCFDSLSKQKY